MATLGDLRRLGGTLLPDDTELVVECRHNSSRLVPQYERAGIQLIDVYMAGNDLLDVWRAGKAMEHLPKKIVVVVG